MLPLHGGHASMRRLHAIEQDYERKIVKADKPWLFRTYAGHSTAKASNALYRKNLAKGSDGAFGRLRPADPDRLRPRSPACPRRGQSRRAHLPSWRHAALFEGIPLAEMNTSMTINATAPGPAARPLCRARRRAGADKAKLTGTVQNDILKEYLSRGTMCSRRRRRSAGQGRDRLHRARDAEMEPDQCLLLPFAGSGRDAGAGIAFALANAEAVLDAVKNSGEVPPADFPELVGASASSSMPACASSPKVRRRAFVDLWDEITEKRYGVKDPALAASATACR